VNPATRALDPALREELRRGLLEARRALLRTVVITDEELATLEAHQPGGPIEDTARDQVLDVLSRIDGRDRHALDEIYVAHAKLEAGTLGICEECGGEIPLERLRAMPAARYCLSCQTHREARPAGSGGAAP
jgi:RNA polymerase-binding transcription factor DksA